MTEKDDTKEEGSEVWFWVFVIIILTFLGGVIAIIAVAIADMNENLPSDIDVVIYDQGRERFKEQIRAVQKYMTFVKQIHVVSTAVLEDYAGKGNIPVSYTVDATLTTQEAAFEKIPSLPNISDHAMFLSDRTFPCYKILKTYLFYGQHPRMFNVMQEQAEVSFFSTPVYGVSPAFSYWEPTIVTMVGRVDYMSNHTNAHQYLFDEITREQVVLRNDMNRDIFVTEGNTDSSTDQFNHLESQKPLFATFHVSGSTEESKQAANLFLVDWLKSSKLFE